MIQAAFVLMKGGFFVNDKSGQNIIEYILLLVLVISLLIVALGPNGFFTKRIDGALNAAFNGMETEVLKY